MTKTTANAMHAPNIESSISAWLGFKLSHHRAGSFIMLGTFLKTIPY
jgi:hypothetical protein